MNGIHPHAGKPTLNSGSLAMVAAVPALVLACLGVDPNFDGPATLGGTEGNSQASASEGGTTAVTGTDGSGSSATTTVGDSSTTEENVDSSTTGGSTHGTDTGGTDESTATTGAGTEITTGNGDTGQTCDQCDVHLEVCVDEQCACRTGFQRCAGTCVSTANNPDHCGTCGIVCGATCGDNNCGGNNCNGFDANCDGSCVQFATDPLHCGGCGNPCLGTEVCVDGACQASGS